LTIELLVFLPERRQAMTLVVRVFVGMIEETPKNIRYEAIAFNAPTGNPHQFQITYGSQAFAGGLETFGAMLCLLSFKVQVSRHDGLLTYEVVNGLLDPRGIIPVMKHVAGVYLRPLTDDELKIVNDFLAKLSTMS